MRDLKSAFDTLMLMLLIVPHLILLMEHGPETFPGAEWWGWVLLSAPWLWILWRIMSAWEAHGIVERLEGEPEIKRILGVR